MKRSAALVPVDKVEHRIITVREHRVLLDADLAQLYGVTTANLKRAVSRNQERFPEDFMFRLTVEEARNLRCQIGISSLHGGNRYVPLAFTEHGVAMLSSVLRSGRAIRVNIAIMRAFSKAREYVVHQQELSRKLGELERRIGNHDEALVAILATIRRLVDPGKERRRRKIGFHCRA